MGNVKKIVKNTLIAGTAYVALVFGPSFVKKTVDNYNKWGETVRNEIIYNGTTREGNPFEVYDTSRNSGDTTELYVTIPRGEEGQYTIVGVDNGSDGSIESITYLGNSEELTGEQREMAQRKLEDLVENYTTQEYEVVREDTN